MTEIEYALRAVGFATAALGTCAAVPAATWRLLSTISKQLTAIANKLLGQGTRVRAYSASVSGTYDVTGNSAVRVEHPTGGTLDERLDRIERRLDAVDEQLRTTAAELRQEVLDRKQFDDELRRHVDVQVTRLDQALDEQQQAAVAVDARALPIVLVGAALTTFTAELSENAVVGDVAICVGVGFFFWAWSLLDQERGRAY